MSAIPAKPPTNKPATSAKPGRPAGAPPLTDAQKQENYRERFNVLSVRLQRQLDGLVKLAKSRVAAPTPEDHAKAVAWFTEETQACLRAMKTPNGVKSERRGPL